jgi:hypothetical protein
VAEVEEEGEDEGEDEGGEEQQRHDLITVIVRALAPFEDARRAVVDALRMHGGIALCPG